MFDTTGIQDNSNNFVGSPSPRGSKYAPISHKYTLPPKKQRGTGGIDNGKSPVRMTTGKKYKRAGTSALTGVAVGAVAYGATR
jgi:hypothetical protein